MTQSETRKKEEIIIFAMACLPAEGYDEAAEAPDTRDGHREVRSAAATSAGGGWEGERLPVALMHEGLRLGRLLLLLLLLLARAAEREGC